MLHVDHLDELADHQRDGLDALDFFFGSQQLLFEVLVFLADELFLQVDELDLGLRFLHPQVEVFVREREVVHERLRRRLDVHLFNN